MKKFFPLFLIVMMLSNMHSGRLAAAEINAEGSDMQCSLLAKPGVMRVGAIGQNVLVVQKILNSDTETLIADAGAGSPGMETTKYGALTSSAVRRFQEKYKNEVLIPAGISGSTGVIGALTRKKLYSLCNKTPETQSIEDFITHNTSKAISQSNTAVSIPENVAKNLKLVIDEVVSSKNASTSLSHFLLRSSSTISAIDSLNTNEVLPVSLSGVSQTFAYAYGNLLPITLSTKETGASVSIFIDGKRAAIIPTSKFEQGVYVYKWETLLSTPGSHVVIATISKEGSTGVSYPALFRLVRFGGGDPGLSSYGSGGSGSSLVSGACGVSSGSSFSVAPTALLCSAGTPTSATLVGGQWVWGCAGLYGGSNATCVATVAATSTQSTTTYQYVSDAYDTPTKNYLGMNLWFPADYDGTLAFVDVMKESRPWQDAAWSPAQPPLDTHGWPMADASTVILTGSPSEVNGSYKLKFNGKADISFLFASNGLVSNKAYDANLNETSADVLYTIGATTSIGLVMRNTQRTASSATGTGFTNLRLYRPGYPSDGSVVFTTPFVDILKKSNVIRMMDWTDTNQNLMVNWADRKTPLDFQKVGPGTSGTSFTVASSKLGEPIEHQIQLCNEVHSDCWFNLPVLVSDDYITNLAQAIKYGTDGTNPYTSVQTNPVYPPLNANLKVYLEYGNEIWNSSGGFYSQAAIRNIIDVLPVNHPVNTPVESNYYYKIWKYQAYRISATSDIFRSIFGDSQMMTRIRPVMMSQLGDGQTSLSSPLNWLDAYAKRQSPPRSADSYIYGAGGSGYYSTNNAVATIDRGNGDIFFANAGYPTGSLGLQVGVDAMWAYNFGAKRIAYEGGPSLDNYTTAQANSINLDPRMQSMITKSHDIWSAGAGDLLVYYALRGPSQWEFTNSIANSSSPKLLGLDELRARPRATTTIGALLPGEIVAMDYASNYLIRTGFHYSTTCSGLPCDGGNDLGEWVAIPGRATSTFEGLLSVKALSFSSTTMQVYVNGKAVGLASISGNGALQTSNSIPVTIPAGLVVVRLEVTQGGMNLRSVVVQ